jgi:tRNA threonylcarbamoyladenosine biosynthesis protein TsaB
LNILGIETSTSLGQIALSCDNTLYQCNATGTSHSQSVLEMIQQCLDQAELTLGDIDCISVSRGPGSFTGLRIGIAVAQGLSFSHNIPIVAVSSLAALAETVREKASDWLTPPTLVLATLDARMQQVYCGWYAVDTDIPRLLNKEQVLSPEGITELGNPLNDGELWHAKNAVIAGGASHYQASLPASVNALWRGDVFAHLQPSAAALLRIALVRFNAGETISATALEPVYLRNNVTS